MGSLGIDDAVLVRAHAVIGDLHADAREVLTGRAALLGLTPARHVSAGGATHLLRCADGWCALTLSRADDIAALPALLEVQEVPAVPDEVWSDIHRWAALHTVGHVTGRGRLLGLPVATLGEAAAAAPRVQALGSVADPRPLEGLLVVDLTSMWAGPLCSQLLARAGAVVIKVESPNRPDGTRAGDQRFFDWMNGGKLSYSIDFDRDQIALKNLLMAADIVLEGSRPAALARRGLGALECPARPGRVWLRVTGYGADGDHATRVAFGDDAAVAGGLVGRHGTQPFFIGDAIADPLTGLESARAVVDSVACGGGELIDVSMAAVAATYASLPAMQASRPGPTVLTAPCIGAPAPALGHDNAVVERLVADRAEVLSTPC